MEKLTYRQAYDLIIDAYFKDEIKPMDSQFCFCGTLAPNRGWYYADERGNFPYSSNEYGRMEDALFLQFEKYRIVLVLDEIENKNHPYYEDTLFEGMCAALLVLRQIHVDRGEDVDEIPIMKKREITMQ